jgi:hypothetical protein
MLVGPPSVKKSPVFRTAMAPVYAEQAAANEEHVAALASYHARKTEASKAKKEREQAEKRAAAATAAKRERERESKQANEALRKQRLAGFKAACKAAREGHHEACKAAKAAGLPAPKLVLPDPPPTMETPLAEIAAGAAAVAAMASAAGEPDIGEPPVRRRVVVDDATVEALSEVLKHEVNATGQVIAGSEEGISFVVPSGYSGAQGAREIAARLELSGSGGKVVDRISRPEVFAPEWSLSFLGTTQPDTLSEATRNATRNGMLQRLFWLFGSAYPESENVRERLDLQRDYADIVRRLYGLRGAHGHVVQFSPEAHDTRREFAGYVDRLIALVEHDEPRMADHLGKAKGYYARVCLVMHLIEQADGIERPVSQDTASRAARLFVEYLLPHISAFYETTAEGSRSDLVPAALRRVAQVASLILRKPLQGVTAGVLGAGLNFWSSASLDEQGAILSTLVSHGWLRTDGNYSDQGTFLGEEGISRGRPTLWRYTVNPAVHDGRFSARRDVLQAAADARVTARGLPTMRAAD